MLKNRYFYIILLIIFILGGFFRFYNIASRGLLDWDEGYYLELIKTQRAVIGWVFNWFFGNKSLGSFSSYILENGGAVCTYAKDGFLIFVLISSYIIGLKSYTSIVISAIFGTLTIWIIYLLGRKLFGRREGLMSMFLIAISSYHIHYSRSGFPQATSAFFFYLGLLFFVFSIFEKENVSKGNKFLALSGLSIGYALCCHYNMFLMVISVYILEFIFQHRENMSIADRLRRFGLLISFNLLPILLFGLISEGARLAIYSNPKWIEAVRGSTGKGDFISFFMRLGDFLKPIFSTAKPVTLAARERDFLFYFKILWEWDGPFILILTMISIAFLLYRLLAGFDYSEFIILFLVIASLAFWSIYGWQLTRSFLSVIPAICLMKGRTVMLFVNSIRGKSPQFARGLLIFVLAAVIVSEARFLNKVIHYKSGYPAAIEYMKRHNGIKHLSSQYTISRFLVGRKNALDITVSFEGIDAKKRMRQLYEKEGYRYLLLDQAQYISDSNPIVNTANKTRPVFSARHSTTANIYENDAVGFPDKVKREPEILEVFQLEDIIYD